MGCVLLPLNTGLIEALTCNSGGATFAIMVSLYSSLRSYEISNHSAWRAAFAIVPYVFTIHIL